MFDESADESDESFIPKPSCTASLFTRNYPSVRFRLTNPCSSDAGSELASTSCNSVVNAINSGMCCRLDSNAGKMHIDMHINLFKSSIGFDLL